MEHQLEKVYAVAALRVSSNKQGLQGDSPEQQKQIIEGRLKQFSASLNKEIIVKEWFDIVESGSGEMELQPMVRVIEYCKQHGNIKYLFIKSIDRFTRAGGTMYDLLKTQLAKYGTKIVDAYGVIGGQEINTMDHLGLSYKWSNYNPTETNEYLVAKQGKDEVRDILTRMIGAEVHYTRLGYWARSCPPGFELSRIDTPVGQRYILVPHKIEGAWFVSMFECKVQGLSDQETVDKVNALGFQTRKQKLRSKLDKRQVVGTIGGNKLTVKLLQKYLRNTIYCGVNTEKWTNGVPIKCNFPGLVSIKIFNEANKGKISIFEDVNGLKVYHGVTPPWRLRKNKFNPNFPFKFLLCPKCRKPLLGSFARGKLKKYYPQYHCNRDHYWGVSGKTMNETVENFVSNIKFSEEFMDKLKNRVISKWEDRERLAATQKISLNEKENEIEYKITETINTIKRLSSPVAIKMMEDELEKLEQEKASLIVSRDKKEDEQYNIQELLNHAKYFIEHLEEMLLGGPDAQRKSTLFGLLFEETPTYEELNNGTPKLRPLFKLNQDYIANQNTLGGLTIPEMEHLISHMYSISQTLQNFHYAYAS